MEIMTVQEVADALRVSAETVRNLIQRGELQGFRVGRVWRVRLDSVDRLVNVEPQPA